MTTIFLACFGFAALAADEPSRGAIAWSPSGEWVAFSLEVPTLERNGKTFRLFEADPADPEPKVEPRTRGGKTRLWLVRVAGQAPVALDECEGALTAPVWRPDGTALAYGKLSVDRRTGSGRFSIVVRDGSDRPKILWSLDLTDARGEIARVRDAIPAWSPDGASLAAPRLKPEGLIVLRSTDGKLLKQLDGASLPSFSPSGDRLAFQHAGAPPTIELIDADWSAPPRRAADLFVLQPPAWTREGDALVVIAPQGAPWRQLDISRIDCESEQTVHLQTLSPGANLGPVGLSGGDLALTEDRAEWIATFAHPSHPSRIARGSSAGSNMPFRASGPVVPSPVWSISVAPRSKRLALRVGAASLPAFWDQETEILSPIAPDDETARAWLAMLVEEARNVLDEIDPSPTFQGKPFSRPTLLPMLGEAPLPGDGALRLRKLIRTARPLSERPMLWRDPKTGAIVPGRDQVRLFLAALDDDASSALTALDSVEPRMKTDADRLRLLALRGQLFVRLGEIERARGVADYLREAADEMSARKRIESTAIGDALAVDDAQDAFAELLRRWSASLHARIADLERGRKSRSPGDSKADRPSRVRKIAVERPKAVRRQTPAPSLGRNFRRDVFAQPPR